MTIEVIETIATTVTIETIETIEAIETIAATVLTVNLETIAVTFNILLYPDSLPIFLKLPMLLFQESF